MSRLADLAREHLPAKMPDLADRIRREEAEKTIEIFTADTNRLGR